MWTNIKIKIASWFLITLIAGCGGNTSFQPSVKVYPIKGKLEYQGKPMPGVTLIFNPIDETQKIKPQATTDGEGNFVATTFQTGDGAPEGDFIITLVVRSNESDSAREDAEVEGRTKATKIPFPPKYLNPTTSGLKIKVTPGNPDLGVLSVP